MSDRAIALEGVPKEAEAPAGYSYTVRYCSFPATFVKVHTDSWPGSANSREFYLAVQRMVSVIDYGDCMGIDRVRVDYVDEDSKSRVAYAYMSLAEFMETVGGKL